VKISSKQFCHKSRFCQFFAIRKLGPFSIVQGGPKILASFFVRFITSSNIDHNTTNIDTAKCQCLKATSENKSSVRTHSIKINNRKQCVCCLNYCLKQLSFPAVLHQMFNVSVLLLNDALLKCVVTEVVLIYCFETLIFHKVV